MKKEHREAMDQAVNEVYGDTFLLGWALACGRGQYLKYSNRRIAEEFVADIIAAGNKIGLPMGDIPEDDIDLYLAERIKKERGGE